VKNNNTTGLVLCMLLCAVLLQLMPVAGDWLLWKPNFLLLVMIAWMLYFPDQYGIEFSVIVGLIADLLFGSTLGYHVFVFSICGLIVISFHRVVVYLQAIHRVTLVFVLVLLIELLRATIHKSLDMPLFLNNIFSLAIISSLFWIPLDKLVCSYYLRHK
jgi:rod shape-determining protein MreD